MIHLTTRQGVFSFWVYQKFLIQINFSFASFNCSLENLFRKLKIVFYCQYLLQKGDKRLGKNFKPMSVTPMNANFLKSVLLKKLKENITKRKRFNDIDFVFLR